MGGSLVTYVGALMSVGLGSKGVIGLPLRWGFQARGAQHLSDISHFS